MLVLMLKHIEIMYSDDSSDVDDGVDGDDGVERDDGDDVVHDAGVEC